jgi:DNA invertase Pin-like site-specific DNA recombinase
LPCVTNDLALRRAFCRTPFVEEVSRCSAACLEEYMLNPGDKLPDNHAMAKAFAYLRVSGKGQVGGDGFTRQLGAIKAYAAQHGIKIVKVFREEGVSGAKDLEDRPAFTEMLTALHSNGVKLIMVEALHRLARDLMVQETIIADLRKHSFDLISVAEPDLLKDDPTRTLLRQMMGAVAQYEKSMLVIKLRGARLRKKASVGRCEGAKPYGTLPGEAEVLERMKELRARGAAYDKIALQLATEGFKPRRGKRWHGFAVNTILRANLPN